MGTEEIQGTESNLPVRTYMRSGLPTKFSPEEVAQAIAGSHGILSHAARRLGCSRSTIYKMCDQYPELQDALEDARQEANDAVESALFADASTPGGNPIPKIFWLKARAGWIETSRREQININIEPQYLKIGDRVIEFAWVVAASLPLVGLV